MQQFESRCICMSGLKRQNELHRHGEVVKIVPVAADGEVHFARPLKWIIVYEAVPQSRTNPKRDAPSRRVSFGKPEISITRHVSFFFARLVRETSPVTGLPAPWFKNQELSARAIQASSTANCSTELHGQASCKPVHPQPFHGS